MEKLVTRKYLDETWDKANRTLHALDTLGAAKEETMYMKSLKTIKFLVDQIWNTATFCGFCKRIIPSSNRIGCNCPPAQGVRAARAYGIYKPGHKVKGAKERVRS